MTPKMTLKAVRGRDTKLPCLAVGHPRPIVTWIRPKQSQTNHKFTRWMGMDGALTLRKVQPSDAGLYNCTATNIYRTVWNTIQLVVQVPPSPPAQIKVHYVANKALNITWVNGNNGNSDLQNVRIEYMVDNNYVDASWEVKELEPKPVNNFLVPNVTAILLFRLSAVNEVGRGQSTEIYQASITPKGIVLNINKGLRTAASMRPDTEIREMMIPVMIGLIILVTLILLILFVASYDREQRRMRKPSVYRLCLCRFKNKHREYYNEGPYGEVDMPWPWNIATNRHSGAFEYPVDTLDNQKHQINMERIPFQSENEDQMSTPTSIHPPAYNVIMSYKSHSGDKLNGSQSSMTGLPYQPYQSEVKLSDQSLNTLKVKSRQSDLTTPGANSSRYSYDPMTADDRSDIGLDRKLSQASQNTRVSQVSLGQQSAVSRTSQSTSASSRKQRGSKKNRNSYPSIKTGGRLDRGNQNFPGYIPGPSGRNKQASKPPTEMTIMERYLASQQEMEEDGMEEEDVFDEEDDYTSDEDDEESDGSSLDEDEEEAGIHPLALAHAHHNYPIVTNAGAAAALMKAQHPMNGHNVITGHSSINAGGNAGQKGQISPISAEREMLLRKEQQERLSRGSADGKSGGTTADMEDDDGMRLEHLKMNEVEDVLQQDMLMNTDVHHLTAGAVHLPNNIANLNQLEMLDNTWGSINNAPRVLLRGNPDRGPNNNPNNLNTKKQNRKSLDSLIMRTLEHIEEANKGANNNNNNNVQDNSTELTVAGNNANPQGISAGGLEQHLSRETCMIIKEMIGRRGARSYDSISSACSSSVGELKKAYEFGKKWGLQKYDIPAYLIDHDDLGGHGDDPMSIYSDMDEDTLKSINEHLDKLEIANFSAVPANMNDVQVQIPLPVRVTTQMLERSGSESDMDQLRDPPSFEEQSQTLV